MDMRSTQRRSEFGQRVLDARTHAKMTQHTLAKAVGMSQGTLGETEKQALSSTFTAQIAMATGVNAYWLATGEGEMLGKDLIDADQTEAMDGAATGQSAMLAAVNILGICLQRMDEESRKAASHFLKEMAASPTGGWSGRLVDLIEKYSPPGLFEEIGIYVRAGNYSLSSRNHRPKIGSKSGNVQTVAIEKSNEPAGQDNASPSEDRSKDQNRGGDGAAGSS